MKAYYSIIITILLVPIFNTIECIRNTYIIDIRRNSYGVDPDLYVGTYFGIEEKVVLAPIDTNNPDKIIIPRVYVRRLTSDPPGHNFIGTIPNPQMNPGFIHEYTSTKPVFDIYATKY